VVVVGLIALALVYANRQEKSIQIENEQALIKVTDSVAEGIAAIMLEGHAKIAREFAERLKTVENALDYRILRVDGTEAFVDNRTVDAVNEKLGEEEFRGRKTSPEPIQVLPKDEPRMLRVVEAHKPDFQYETLVTGQRLVTILFPIESSTKCQKCHTDPTGVRGLIKLTTSLDAVDHDIESTWRMSIIMISVALVVIGFGVYLIAHKTVVAHLNDISAAMDSAGQGNLDISVNVHSQDEIGRMAESFNQMSFKLLNLYQGIKNEKSKLSTLIQGAKEGIVVTNAAGDVVLVNAAAEEILSKSEQMIKQEGFLYLFDNEEWMQESLDLSHTNNAPRLLTWSGRVLSIKASTINNEEQVVIGSAALIRDITEEKRLEEELKRRSITDGLTGLYNRRHFDSTLTYEFKRWKRYKTPLSVIMLDVDHFKKFNDTHGHDCGDHVLIAIAKVLREQSQTAHSLVLAFRYGGEEMVVIAANARLADGAELAENLREKIGALVIDGLRVTVSIGVASTPEQSPENGEALLKLADEALYVAKKNGRNQVRTAPVETTA
jgi:diguanylate cyclase (GGDEF)-like protein/PAS domain S-box-containing protein